MGYPTDELFEKLASIEHDRWADWQKYLHSQCYKDTKTCFNHVTKIDEEIETGGLVIAKSSVKHWERQIATDYKDLSEKEKDSDREQVLRYWDLIPKE